jgi:hypothetical protein
MQMNMRNIVKVAEVTLTILAQTYMSVFLICSVSVTNFAMLFSSETACGPPGEQLRTTGGPWTTV